MNLQNNNLLADLNNENMIEVENLTCSCIGFVILNMKPSW